MGMIVGEHARPNDLGCTPTKTKKLGNYRSQTKDIDVGLKVPRRPTLDQALEWIAADELVEITPTSIRMRKAILDAEERKGSRSARLRPGSKQLPKASSNPHTRPQAANVQLMTRFMPTIRHPLP